MSKPKNWPPALSYLSHPLHHKSLSKNQLTHLKTKPSSSTSNPPLPSLPPSSTPLPSPLVRIQPISSPSHPAHLQSGLFATRDLPPGTFILPYLGLVHPSSATNPSSDYDLWLDRETDIAVDASTSGNEARFVNDYRGVADRPNAEFGTGWCERWGELCVGFWVMPAEKVGRIKGKGKARAEPFRGIKKGEEILVSYGKGFWGERAQEGTQEGTVEESG